MPTLFRDEALTNLKDNILQSLETAGGFGQVMSLNKMFLNPFPKFTSARTMLLAFVVSTCMKHLLFPLLRVVLR